MATKSNDNAEQRPLMKTCKRSMRSEENASYCELGLYDQLINGSPDFA